MPSFGSGYFSSMYFTIWSESPILWQGRRVRTRVYGRGRAGAKYGITVPTPGSSPGRG